MRLTRVMSHAPIADVHILCNICCPHEYICKPWSLFNVWKSLTPWYMWILKNILRNLLKKLCNIVTQVTSIYYICFCFHLTPLMMCPSSLSSCKITCLIFLAVSDCFLYASNQNEQSFETLSMVYFLYPFTDVNVHPYHPSVVAFIFKGTWYRLNIGFLAVCKPHYARLGSRRVFGQNILLFAGTGHQAGFLFTGVISISFAGLFWSMANPMLLGIR